MVKKGIQIVSEEKKDSRGNMISITPSGFFGSSEEMIQSRENFMTQEELSFLLEAAKKITVWDETETHYNENGTVIYDSLYWKDRVATQPSLDKNNKDICPIIINMQQRLKKEVDAFFNVDAIPTSPAIVRWLPGQLQNHLAADVEPRPALVGMARHA